MKEKQEKLGEALLKVALGFQVAEVTEEFAEVDGELKLTKRRRTKKDVPPDLKAVQMLLAEQDYGYATMTDEELEKEKQRLLEELKKSEGGMQVCVEVKKNRAGGKKDTPKKTTESKKKQGELYAFGTTESFRKGKTRTARTRKEKACRGDYTGF